MSVSKTRQKLVDVARQLFAKNGIANTTMNDIAVASGKGRRTPISVERKMSIMQSSSRSWSVFLINWMR